MGVNEAEVAELDALKPLNIKQSLTWRWASPGGSRWALEVETFGCLPRRRWLVVIVWWRRAVPAATTNNDNGVKKNGGETLRGPPRPPTVCILLARCFLRRCKAVKRLERLQWNSLNLAQANTLSRLHAFLDVELPNRLRQMKQKTATKAQHGSSSLRVAAAGSGLELAAGRPKVWRHRRRSHVLLVRVRVRAESQWRNCSNYTSRHAHFNSGREYYE